MVIIVITYFRDDKWMYYVGGAYKPLSPSSIRYLVQVIYNTIYHDVTQIDFTDLGCGKGDVLAGLCRLPFNTLTGIEIDRNIYDYSTYRFVQEGRVRIVYADIFEYVKTHISSDHVQVYFMYEPLWRSSLFMDAIILKYTSLI